MMVAYEQYRESIKDFMILSSLALGLGVNEFKGLFDSLIGILACEAAVYEIVEHVHDYECAVSHDFIFFGLVEKSLISCTSLLMIPILRL